MTFFGQKCVVLLGSQVEISTSVFVLGAINHTTLTRVGKGWGGHLIHSVGWQVAVRSSSGSAATVTLLPTIQPITLQSCYYYPPHLLLGTPAQSWMLKKRPISDNSQLAPKNINCDTIGSKAVGSAPLCLCSPASWNEGTPPSQSLELGAIPDKFIKTLAYLREKITKNRNTKKYLVVK